MRLNDSATDSTPISHLEREVSSGLSELPKVRGIIRRVCGASSLDDDATVQFELAMNEAASNIMKHAYEGRADGRIKIVADMFADRVVILLFHWGIAFQPPKRPRLPRVETYQEDGYGLYIIEQSVDIVKYSRDRDGRNCVMLTKHCRSG